MIKIQLSFMNPIKFLDTDKTIKVIFDYDKDIIEIIKGLEYSAYNPKDKTWEVSPKCFTELYDMLDDYDTEYVPSVDEFRKTAAELAANAKKPILKVIAAKATTYLNREYDYILKLEFEYNYTLIQFIKKCDGCYNYKDKFWEISPLALNDITNKAEKLGFEVNIEPSVEALVKKTIELINKKDKNDEEYYSRDWEGILNNYKFKTTPFSYQRDGILAALKTRNLLLGDEQGLGKTLQAIYTADIKSSVEGYKYTLIVCGVNGLKYNWISEIKEHLDADAYILGSRVNRKGALVEGTLKDRLTALEDLKEHKIDSNFIITNIETLRNTDITRKIKELCDIGIIGNIIIDEAHRIINVSSQQGSALQYLTAKNKLALTGTPVINKPFDLYATLSWLGAEKRRLYDFQRAYGVYVSRRGQGRHYEELVGYRNLGDLSNRLQGVLLRREKSDVLDLPDVVFTQDFIEMSKEQAKLYTDIKEEMISEIDNIVLSSNPLAKFTRLRQAATCPSILSEDINKNPKFTRALELIIDAIDNNKKVIVYSNFAVALERFKDVLNRENIKTYSVTGETQNKKAEIDKFKEDGNVLLGTIKALGTGFTITEADTVIFLDLPWTYADLQQAIDRCHRIGQKNTVTVTALSSLNTVDAKLFKIVKKKEDLFRDMMEGKDIKGVNRKKLTKSLLGLK